MAFWSGSRSNNDSRELAKVDFDDRGGVPYSVEDEIEDGEIFDSKDGQDVVGLLELQKPTTVDEKAVESDFRRNEYVKEKDTEKENTLSVPTFKNKVIADEVEKSEPSVEAIVTEVNCIEETDFKNSTMVEEKVSEVEDSSLKTSQKVEGKDAINNDHIVILKTKDTEMQDSHRLIGESEDWSSFTKTNDVDEETTNNTEKNEGEKNRKRKVDLSEEFNQNEIKKVEIAGIDMIRENNSIKIFEEEITEIGTNGEMADNLPSVGKKLHFNEEPADSVTTKDDAKSTFTTETKVNEENQNFNHTTKEEDKETIKRKCDDSGVQETSAKIAKLESDEAESKAEPELEPEDPDEKAKKSEVNASLIQQIFQNPMTSSWESKSHKPYELHSVNSNTVEYRNVQQTFKASTNLEVTEIKRVENPYLLGLYLLKKDKMERNCKGLVQKRKLFHGTRESNIDGICRFNFDWRRNGTSRGHKFGRGVSFSPKSSYARHYTKGDNVMILAEVLVSEVVEGNHRTVIPPEPYDSTRNYSGDVIVKYDDDDFYPAYIIYYKENTWDSIFD